MAIGDRYPAPEPSGGDVAIDADILAILACPSDDHAPLREDHLDSDGGAAGGHGADVLICTYCGTVYPIRDGIPVLLTDDATPGPNGIGVARTATPAG